jgi:DNA-directed RNA polymerase specialized sigma24 family protein
MPSEENAGERIVTSPMFPLTHWSVVLSAGRRSSPDAEAALERLCRTYWYPLYAYLRRAGHDESAAQDLIQSFFAALIEREWVSAADPAKGRFRSFLIVCLKRFVAAQAQKASAWKRGGRDVIVSLDDEKASERYQLESVENLSPEMVFDRRWALTLLERAWDRLRAECDAAGKRPLFEHLRAVQAGEAQVPSQEQLARSMDLTESALKSALFRLRARSREILREEVAQTVSDPREVDDEIRYLGQVVSS